jgi:ribonuclease P protein subunit RPR2
MATNSRTKKRSGSAKPAWQRETALERIRSLFEQAEHESREHPERSKRYMEMALRLSTRYNVRLPPGLRRRVCRSCHAYLVPGRNSTVRTSPSRKAVLVTCRECGRVHRHPYIRERSSRTRK